MFINQTHGLGVARLMAMPGSDYITLLLNEVYQNVTMSLIFI